MTTINGRACVVNGVAVDKVFSNGKQVYGRNLVLRTATAFTMTGSGSDDSRYMNHLSKKIAKGTTITMDFDVMSTNATGKFAVTFVGGGYEGSGWYQMEPGTQHHSYTFTTGYDYDNGVQLRIINSTGTVTVSNLIISESSKDVPWTPAPEDVLK